MTDHLIITAIIMSPLLLAALAVMIDQLGPPDSHA